MADKTLYEYAYKGDFDYVVAKLDENPSLLTTQDSVSFLLV